MTTRRPISWTMAGAACVAVAIEAASNAAFAYSIGGLRVTLWGVPVLADGLLLALGSVAVAVFQAQTATALLHPAPGESRRTSFVLLLVCLCYSVGAMTSHVLERQRLRAEMHASAGGAYRAEAGKHATAKKAYDRADAEYRRTLAEIDRLGTPRPVPVVQAEISAARVAQSVWTQSKQCSEQLDKDWIRSACGPVLDLYKERGASAKLAEITADLGRQRDDLAKLQAALAAADDRLASVARPTEPSIVERYLSAALPWALAVAVEVCGTFGFAAMRRKAPAHAPAPVPAPPAADPVAPRAKRPAKPSGLLELLAGLADGSTSAPGCIVLPDGWIDAPQSALGAVLGVAPATVCRRIKELETAGAIASRATGRKSQIRVLPA